MDYILQLSSSYLEYEVWALKSSVVSYISYAANDGYINMQVRHLRAIKTLDCR
jgi:hypothetical protein